MRSEAACDAARAAISMQLDGELSGDEARSLDDHLASCADCRRYRSRLHEVRRKLRLVPAPPARDLTGPVLAELARSGRQDVQTFRIKLAAVAAAAAALLVLATALPIFDRAPDVARAGDITRSVFAAGRSLARYHATFDITERGWHPDVPTRRFSAEVWFDAPESFRLHIEDLTAYPSGAWPTNDVRLVSGPSRWWIRESYSCPVVALPGCAAGAGLEERTTVARQPFDGSLEAPRDLVIPLDSLAGPETFVVGGRTEVNGRTAHQISLPYRQAFPLVEALQVGGSWASFRPEDHVDLWVDTETSFPLRFEISRGAKTLLEVETKSLDEPAAFEGSLFEAPMGGAVNNGGFEPGPGPDASMLPRDTAGLHPYRSGRNAQGQRIATYADGLSYLKVIVDRSARPAPLLVQSAEIVRLTDSSQGFYRPATPIESRRLDVYSDRHHVQLVTNLRRSDLLRIAASLPLPGRAPVALHLGTTTIERVDPDALADIDYARRPTRLPKGYTLVSTVRTKDHASTQLVQYYMPTESGSSTGMRIVQSKDVEALPPSSEDLVSVRVNGVLARWSEERGELEWIDDDGVYRAVAAPSFGLDYVLSLASGMR